MTSQRAYSVAIGVAALLMLVDTALYLWLRTRSWTLIVPGVVLAIAIAGPNPRIARWRDALALICIASLPVVLIVPQDWPRPVRIGFNTPGTAGIVLLLIAYLFGDGLGAAIRERSFVRLRESARAAYQACSASFSILIVLGVADYLMRKTAVAPWLVAVSTIPLLCYLIPPDGNLSGTISLRWVVSALLSPSSWRWQERWRGVPSVNS